MGDPSRVPPAAGERLAKVIARSGLCSRRDAEDWIRGGRVSVNGGIIRTPAYNVNEKDRISVDGEPLAARSGTRVWLYHKPPGLVVTEKDPEGRATIFDALSEAGLPRVLTVGRLDLNTEGLLLLTNDGGLKRVLELPATGWLRRYRVRAYGSVTQAQLDGLKEGIEVDGVKYGPVEAVLEREQGSNVWLIVSLREGKNREVKNVLASLGLVVNRLIRVSYGPFQLGDLPVGGVDVVRSRVLRDQLGKKLAEQAGVDFDSDLPEAMAQNQARRAPDRPGRSPDPRGRGPAGRPDARREPPRTTGRTPRVFFDDGRPPEDYVREEKRPTRDRAGPATDGARPAARSTRPDDRKERAPRPAGGRPFKPRGDGDRPDRPARSAGDRPRSSRPAGDRPDRPQRPAGDRPRSPRPAGDRADRPPRPAGDRPRSPRPAGDRPDRSPRPAGDRPRSPRPAGDRADRPPRPAGDRPRSPRPAGDRPDRPQRPTGDRPRSSRPAGDRPARSPPPASNRPGGAKQDRPDRSPRGGKPAGKPRAPSGRPGSPQRPRPGGGRPPRKPRA